MFWKQPPPPPPPPDENEWSTLVGFAVAQAIFWFLISQSWSPLVKMIVSFVKSIPGGKSNVYLNLKAQYTGAGFPPPESEDAALSGHAFSYVCLIHHLCGTGLLVASYMYNSAFLFRFGLSFEIGEGVQHALQMLHAVFYPPGTPPVCDMSKAVWPFILFHHSLGLLAGTVAHLYLANNAEVQVLCALLLGAAVPGFANLPLFPFGDLQGTGTVAKINCILQLCAFTFMLYTRVINFFPLCYRLVPATFAEHGLVAGYVRRRLTMPRHLGLTSGHAAVPTHCCCCSLQSVMVDTVLLAGCPDGSLALLALQSGGLARRACRPHLWHQDSDQLTHPAPCHQGAVEAAQCADQLDGARHAEAAIAHGGAASRCTVWAASQASRREAQAGGGEEAHLSAATCHPSSHVTSCQCDVRACTSVHSVHQSRSVQYGIPAARRVHTLALSRCGH